MAREKRKYLIIGSLKIQVRMHPKKLTDMQFKEKRSFLI